MSGAGASMLSLLRDVVPSTSCVVAAITGGQWSDPTPCEEMDVHALAAHLVGGLEQLGDVAAGRPVDVTAATEVAPDDVSARFEAAAGRMLEEWSAQGFDDPSIRVAPMFAPIVPAPDGASAIDRLAAFLGRDPRDWSTS